MRGTTRRKEYSQCNTPFLPEKMLPRPGRRQSFGLSWARRAFHRQGHDERTVFFYLELTSQQFLSPQQDCDTLRQLRSLSQSALTRNVIPRTYNSAIFESWGGWQISINNTLPRQLGTAHQRICQPMQFLKMQERVTPSEGLKRARDQFIRLLSQADTPDLARYWREWGDRRFFESEISCA